MRIEGACHCGRISYVAEIDPDKIIICHCTDCQIISGGPYRANAPTPIDKFALRGEPKLYVKTAESGRKLGVAFCGECGSALYSAALEKPAVVNLRLGAVKERARLTPKGQFWCRSAMPWAMDISQIPQSPEQARPA